MSKLVDYEGQLIHSNPLKDLMEEGKFGTSFTITIAPGLEVLQLAKYAGLKSITLNMEHRKTDVETAADVCVMCLALGISPVIVVPCNQSEWISRLLDNGAQGIVVPRINTAEMARTLVKYSKHRPIGERPLAFTPQLNFDIKNFNGAFKAQNDTTLTIPMIETKEGVENCGEIARVPGVDMIFIGVHDLSDDLGAAGQFDNPELQAAIKRICRAGTEAGIFLGLGGMENRLDLVTAFRKEFPAIRFAMAGRDSFALLKGMRDVMAKMAALDE